MPRQVVARILLVCAVLLAQQTALAHDLWHATAQKAGKADKLCDLHDLLGTVLGAVNAAPAHAELLSFADVGFFSIAVRAAESRPLAAPSRGPPALC
jgi:hypothetical protein